VFDDAGRERHGVRGVPARGLDVIALPARQREIVDEVGVARPYRDRVD